MDLHIGSDSRIRIEFDFSDGFADQIWKERQLRLFQGRQTPTSHHPLRRRGGATWKHRRQVQPTLALGTSQGLVRWRHDEL